LFSEQRLGILQAAVEELIQKSFESRDFTSVTKDMLKQRYNFRNPAKADVPQTVIYLLLNS